MQNDILRAVQDAINAIEFLKTQESLAFIENAAELISKCFKAERKLILAGNGGSLCDAMHFAEELTGLFREKRPALPAMAITDPGHLSCTANDLGYDHVFARYVEAFGKKGDVFIGLTTSGNSLNIINAVHVAKSKGLSTILFLGKKGGKLKGIADLELIVDGFIYSDRIQEAHMTAIHIIIEMIEKKMFSNEQKVDFQKLCHVV